MLTALAIGPQQAKPLKESGLIAETVHRSAISQRLLKFRTNQKHVKCRF